MLFANGFKSLLLFCLRVLEPPNCVVSALRCTVFYFRAFRPALEGLHPVVTKLMLLHLPGLLSFTTYTLLVLFWAEVTSRGTLCYAEPHAWT
ncbi:hypothetical protein TSOC_003401, partial [Tetrabaena socialis]